jgi:hypothetical protein
MPLTINVGLSRKTSENFNSAGTSINLTAELDQSLLARSGELQGAIEELYEQAETALDQQDPDAPGSGERRVASPRRTQAGNGHAHSNGNGRSNGRSRQASGGTMTDSQRRAIHAIANRLNLDAGIECHEELGLDLDTLDLRQASQLIDHLKALQTTPPEGRHRGGGR